MIEQYDNKSNYCRKLGHHLKFGYCRQEHSGLPCLRIFDCWFEHFPVREYLEQNFDTGDIAYLSSPPQTKMLTLLDIIQQARNNAESF